MVLAAVILLWVAASVVVVGLCVAASRGDAKQAAALRRGAVARGAYQDIASVA